MSFIFLFSPIFPFPASFSPLSFLFSTFRFGGYILAGLQRKSIKTKNFHFGYYERSPLPRNGNRDAATKPDAAGTTNSAHPTLLFLHGFTSNKESWVRVVMGLPRQWRILVLDMPGHGESSFDPTQDYSPFGMAEKVDMVQCCVCVGYLLCLFFLIFREVLC